MSPLDAPKPTALLRERARQAKKTPTTLDIYVAAAQSFDAGWSMPPPSSPEWWRRCP